MPETLERTLICREPTIAVELISAGTGLSKSTIKRAMTLGAVWKTKGARTTRLRRAKAIVEAGETVSIYYSEKILSDTPVTPVLISDNGSFSVWHKPAGLMSSGTRFGDHCSIYRVVEKQLDRPVFLVHRLDRFAWGVMVLAHGKRAAGELSRQFQHRSVKKIYKTIVHGQILQDQEITVPLDGKEAITRVIPIDRDAGHTLLQVEILTGRRHQIRRHLTSIGAGIVGDRQYGSSPFPELLLAAVSLSFERPDNGERMTFSLPEADHPRLSDLTATPV